MEVIRAIKIHMNNAIETVRTRYTNPTAMLEYCDSRSDLVAQYKTVVRALAIAECPEGRFSLECRDTALVAAALRVRLAEIENELAPIATRANALKADGLSYGEIANFLMTEGFGQYSDIATLIG